MKKDYAEIFNARGHLYNEAGSHCPAARENERAALLDLLGPCDGLKVADIPAGGGYVADGIRSRYGNSTHVVCIEPAVHFAASIHPAFEVRHDPMTRISLPDGSVDAIVSLAGLHHIKDLAPVYAEWKRILRPRGRIAVADVMKGTGPASFLNEFVHAHTPGGHEGIFFRSGDFETALENKGFTNVSEQLISVPWCFPDIPTMKRFCGTLFATSLASEDKVLERIEKHLGWKKTSQGIEMQWCLYYATAELPQTLPAG